jgi:hypothetical protein
LADTKAQWLETEVHMFALRVVVEIGWVRGVEVNECIVLQGRWIRGEAFCERDQLD